MRWLSVAGLWLAACQRPTAVPSRPAPPDLSAQGVTLERFARAELWSWTSAETAKKLVEEGPPLLRVRIHPRPPDASFYDVHVRETGDLGLRALLTSEPFSRTRYAWPNPWGAALGVEDERYGDRLIRVVLRADAVVARFVPREAGQAPVVELPEWSFETMAGAAVPREWVLANPTRLAAVLHVRSVRAGATFVGYREYVLVNESTVQRFELGTPRIRAELGSATGLVQRLLESGAVPAHRAEEGAWLSAVVQCGWLRGEAESVEARWFLTLPFPRARYRDLPAVARALVHAAKVQRVEATWSAD